MFVWKLIQAVVKVVVFVVKAAIGMAVWAAMHPWVVVVVAVGLITVGLWAETQDWFGARLVADLAMGVGYRLGIAAMLSLIFAPVVGAVVGAWEAISAVFGGNLSAPPGYAPLTELLYGGIPGQR